MPIYEYHCEDCGHDFERLVRFSDATTQSPGCPDCQSENTRKRLSTVAAFGTGQAASGSSCGSSGPFR